MGLYPFLVEHLIFPLGDWYLGTRFIKSLKEWRKMDHRSADEIKVLQHNNLQKLIQHCVENVPFYRHIAPQLSGNPFQDIKLFPVLTKSLLREDTERFLSVPKEKLGVEYTSGSSGIQGMIYRSEKENSIAQGIQTHWWEWAGFRLGKPWVQTGMTPKRSRIKQYKDKITRTHFVKAFQVSPEELDRNLDYVMEHQIPLMGGYASSLFVHAQRAKERGMPPGNPSLKSVVSWGDKMFAHYRETIEQQTGAKVFDTYGCTEGIMIAAQCAKGSYHIMTPHVYVEIVDEHFNPMPEGEMGRILVTRLDAFGMPLVRYYLGDLVTLEHPDKRCTCGMPYPLLKQVIGRDTDIIKTKSGKSLIVHFFTGPMGKVPEIKQFRMVQHSLEDIEMEYIPDENTFTPAVLEKLEETFSGLIGEKPGFRYTAVSQIPNTPSGKPQIILSKLPRIS